MHSIAKIFDIIKYLKNEKNQKLKRERIGKMVQKGPKRQKGPKFFFFTRIILTPKRKK